MTPKSINCFISSANRNSTESVYDFTADFNDDLIKCNDDQYIRLNVISFDMLNTMYNCTNQSITIWIYWSPLYPLGYYVDIPDGNYNVYSFIKWLESAYFEYELNNGGKQLLLPENRIKITDVFSISYNQAQNNYTFKKNPNFMYDVNTESQINVKIDPVKILGIQHSTIITVSGVNSGYINMVNYNKVIVRTKDISYDMSTIENIQTPSNKLTFSNILFWTSKQDVEPFRNIAYSNVDGGNSFNVMLHDKRVNYINLQLTNEYGELITDAPDYLLVLQFTIYDKDDWYKDAILQISNSIKQIWVCILWIMENYLKII